MTKSADPTCVDCGTVLTDEERVAYEYRCEKCEAVLDAAHGTSRGWATVARHAFRWRRYTGQDGRARYGWAIQAWRVVVRLNRQPMHTALSVEWCHRSFRII